MDKALVDPRREAAQLMTAGHDMTPRHKRAREYAEAGFPVFPCVVNGKQPATPNGFKDASTDIDQIDAWWAEGDYNIGLCPEEVGWCVIDLDPGAEEHWVSLLKDNGQHPITYEVTTPRGGRHIYFMGSLPASTSKLGPHIDTRGRGSYVLVPPSVIDGKLYEVTYHGRQPTDLPTWIEARLASRDHRVEPSEQKELDLPSSLARARNDLSHRASRGDVAVSGCGGNNRTYQTALDIRDYGVSADACLGLLLEPGGWNDSCLPPWSEDELSVIIHNAYTYAQNKEIGAWQTRPPHEAFAGFAVPAGGETRSRFAPHHFDDFRRQEPPEWIVPEMIPARSTVLLYAPSGSYKSFLATDIFLRECSKGHLCYYVASEGLYGIQKDRSIAWQAANNVSDDKLRDTFKTVLPPALGMPGEGQEFIKAIGDAGKPRLLVFDTTAGVMCGLDINKPTDVAILTRFCGTLIESFGCSIIIVHHVSDKPGGKERGPAGSYAWIANVDVALELNKLDGERRAVELWVRKMKDAPERGVPWTYKLVPAGTSLAIATTDRKEHEVAREEAKPITPRKVGKALIDNDAYGIKKALTTPELAVALFGPEAAMDRRVHKDIERLAPKELKMYCQLVDKMLWWYLDEMQDVL